MIYYYNIYIYIDYNIYLSIVGELTAGELTAGELTAGKLTVGELTAGELTAGELTAGELTTGELTAGKLTVGERTAGKLQMSYQDVAVRQSRDSLSTIFLKNCGRNENLGTTTCPKTVDWGKQGHAP